MLFSRVGIRHPQKSVQRYYFFCIYANIFVLLQRFCEIYIKTHYNYGKTHLDIRQYRRQYARNH